MDGCGYNKVESKLNIVEVVRTVGLGQGSYTWFKANPGTEFGKGCKNLNFNSIK